MTQRLRTQGEGTMEKSNQQNVKTTKDFFSRNVGIAFEINLTVLFTP